MNFFMKYLKQSSHTLITLLLFRSVENATNKEHVDFVGVCDSSVKFTFN